MDMMFDFLTMTKNGLLSATMGHFARAVLLKL